MSSKKLNRWYQLSLSGFVEAQNRGELDMYNLHVREKGKIKEITVPILKPQNLGERMAIDEKTINGICYTILSNRKTNKIALMTDTLKTKYLSQLMSHFDLNKRMDVINLSRDMASNYDWFGRQVFMNSYHVIDKFHVIQNMLVQLQSIRIRYRQEELSKRREAKENQQVYQEKILSNGDIKLQLLARSRGLLFKLPNEFTEHQKERAKLLFDLFPDIKEAYKLINKIRRWYNPPKGKRTYEKTKIKKKKKIKELLKKLSDTGIEEMKNLAFMFKKNLPQILHYFIAKETNAKAEALNQNLQRFINVNYGARNSKFFLYRVKIHFS